MGNSLTRRQLMISGVLVTLGGCARKVPDNTGESPVTIDWYASSMTNTHQDPRQPLIDAFRKQHPRVNVQLISPPTDTDDKRTMLREAISSGAGGPDVYLGDVIWPAEFAAKRLAEPLETTGLIPASFWSQFPEDLVKAASYQNKAYAAPFYADQAVLLYRKDLLAEEGLAVPETWEELERAARVLLDKRRVKYGFLWQGAPYEGLTCVWTEFAADAGVVTPEQPRDLRIDTPEAVRALTFMRHLVDSGVSTGVTNLRELNSMEMFEGGDAVFLRAWNSAYLETAKLSDSPVQGKVGIVPLPYFADMRPPGASTVGGWSLFVSPRTQHLAEALEFVKWLTAVPAQLTVAQYSEIPTNVEVQRHPVVTENAWLATAMDSRAVRRPSNTPQYDKLSRVIYEAVHSALRHGHEPRDALRRAQSRLDGIRHDI